MLKVYLPSLAICTLSLTVNLLVIGTYPLGVIALESSKKQAANNVAKENLEPEILAEINRVRTNPQGYAHWLEEQKQYYDNIWLRLPGEEPIRAHKLGKAINEAIAILQEQQPLPPLSISEQTSAIATQKLEDFSSTNNSIQNISYGRQTAKGIVMSLVVDELFRDRRRRKSLLSPEANDTGVVCKSDPRYARVCAIAYSNSSVDNPIAQQPDTETTTAAPETVKQPEISAPEARETNDEKTETVTDSKSTSNAETTTENVEPEDTETVAEKLPEPPKPQALPTLPEDALKPELPTPEAEPETEENEEKIARTDAEDEVEENEEELAEAEREIEEVESDSEEDAEDEVEENEEELAEVEREIEEVESELEEIESEIAEQEVFEAESESKAEEAEQIATNSDSSRFLENVERGALEEGDRTIEEDGSFYDSYPLEAKSGESFTIALESSEFDAFVALVDAQGNIVEQNDDISEEDSNARIRVTIPENGVYNVIVNAYNKGGTGQYVLTVTR